MTTNWIRPTLYKLGVLLPIQLLLLLGFAHAQSGKGTLTGGVHDLSGAVVVGAAIDLTETQTQAHYRTATSSDGIYKFPELPVGLYKLSISAPSFRDYVQTGITIGVADTATVDVTLQAGQQSETVNVNADASQLKTETSDIGTTVSPEMIEQLPLAVQGQVRSPLQFVQLAPGFAGSTANSPTSQGGFKLNGGQQGGTDMLLDGATIELASPNLQMNYGVSVEAVSEFKVMTNTFPAEYGRASGGIVNLATKSGTNDFHGSVYDFLRNRALDANSWINNHSNPIAPRPVDTQNDFGAIVSGPVIIPKLFNGRDKTFFMANYEGFRFNTGGSNLQSAPTSAMYAGDFSSIENDVVSAQGITYTGRKIYDYTTCTGQNAGRPCLQFPGNKIPYAPDPVFKAAAQYLPHAASSQPYDNLLVTTQNPIDADLWTVRIDQNIGTSQKISASYDHDNRPNTVFYSTGPLETSATNQSTNYARFSHDYVITPNLLNHFGFGFTRRFREEFSGQGSYGGNWPSKIGLKGVSETTFPNISLNYGSASNFVNMPSDGANQFADNTFQFDENVSWQHGSHSIKFGVEHRRQQFNTRWLTGTSGEFSFDTGPTSQLDTPITGFGVASFYLGAASAAYIALPQGVGMRIRYWGMFVQDDWKISPRLTANIGFRYDLPGVETEVDDRISFIDPTLPNPGAGGRPGAYVFEGKGPGRLGTNTPQTPFHAAFGPRLGFAYQLSPSTVLRVGYGIYYSNVKVEDFANNDSAGFFGSFRYAAQPSPQTPAVVWSQIQKYPGSTPPFIDPTVQNGQPPTFILDKTARPGTIQNWTVDIQQQLPHQVMLDVAYVGAHGDHTQAYMHDPNQGNPADMSRGNCLYVDVSQQTTNAACAGQPLVPSPYAGFTGTVSQALRPFPQYSNANLDTSFASNPFGVYTYHAMQMQLQKRYSAGLTVLASFTWSKNLTNSDSEYPLQSAWEGNGASGVLNTYNQKAEKGLSQFDMPESVVLSYTYELPLGRGKKFLNQNAAVNALVGGWQVSGIHYYQSGTPLVVTSPNWDSGIFAGQASSAHSRPNVVAGVNPSAFDGGTYKWGLSRKLNPAAFTPAPNFTFGDAPRTLNTREFANLDEDFSISKQLPTFTERVKAVFRIDMFDAFNRHRFTGFDNGVGDAGFGLATTTSGYRTMQANLRFTY